MIIRKEHALALIATRKDELEDHPIHQLSTNVEAEPFIELEFANLMRMERPLEYTLTYWGRALANIIKEMVDKNIIDHPSNWDERYRWIGSEILMMIETAIKNDDIPGELTLSELEKRGFIEERKIEKKGVFKVINKYAKDIYNVFVNTHPKLIVNKELYEYIKNMPAGPTNSSRLPAGGRFPLILESMRLIAFSVPTSDIYNVTGLGQYIKEACKYIAPAFDILISEDIMLSVEKIVDYGVEELTDTEKEFLMACAYINGDGELLPAGENLLEAYRIWKEHEFKPVKTFNVDLIDIELLKGIKESWDKHKENPEILPTSDTLIDILLYRPAKEYKHLFNYYGRRIYQDIGYQRKEEIKKKFEDVKTVEELFKSFYEKGNRWREKMGDVVQESLYTLESFNLIHAEELNEKKVYYLTEFGNKVLEDIDKRGIRDIPSTSVKAITITNREFGSPNINWYEEAKDRLLIGVAEPTEAGKFYADLAYNIRRLPHITRFELKVLQTIPEKGFFISDVYSKFDETWQEEISYALNKLEARGYIDILQNEAIILTEAGKLIKRALSGTPEGFANPITPLAVRVLEALREVGTVYTKEHKIRVLPKNIKKAVKISGLDPVTFGKEMLILRASKLAGKSSVNEAGLMILEALDLLNE